MQQGGGGYGNYGGGMGNGNANGVSGAAQQSWENGGSAYRSESDNMEQMARSQSYSTEPPRAASPLTNVSSGYAPRTSGSASPVPYSPSAQGNGVGPAVGGQMNIPPLSLNPAYNSNSSRTPVRAVSPVTDSFNQYGYSSPAPYSPYTQYQSGPQYTEQVTSYAAAGEMKHRGGQVHPNDWSAENYANGNGSSSPPQRKAYSPYHQNLGSAHGYEANQPYEYGMFGGSLKKGSLNRLFVVGNLRYLFLLGLFVIPCIWLMSNAVSMFEGGAVSIYPTSGKFDVRIGEKDMEKLGDGISIVGACMNRQENLDDILKNWLTIKDAKEIVLVDWSSEPPLKEIVDTIDNNKIKLVRVNDEPKWVLSRAFNIGVQFASYEKVIKLDCDYALHNNFTESHKIEQGRNFVSGDWENARDENERHLNGAMYVHQKDFWNVLGYDERIQTYGWDDEDMYSRLTKGANLEKSVVNYDEIMHLQHDDSARAQEGVKFVEVETDYNSLLLKKLDEWGPKQTERSAYAVEAHGNVYDVTATVKPSSVEELSAEEDREESWNTALGQRLRDQFLVPWDFLASMSTKNRELLLRNLMERMSESTDESYTPKILFGHCMHGLGNRLRALGSMMSFAKNSNRELVIIWENDEHCGSDFEDLFASKYVTMGELGPKAPFKDGEKYDNAFKSLKVYNYMELEEDAAKDELVVDDPEMHIYYKGAYIMNAPELSDWEQDNENLRSLVPVDEVKQIMEQHSSKQFGNMVGVHIRNRDLAQDIQNVDFSKEYTASASNTMDYWRHKSHYKNFIDRVSFLA
mmetsp:Transcript_20715/g.84173  ORF Transcript_20715/g.84173 Transcript_20715/m.84173 type:complete len:799 (-) Transcript_20715:3136-5532(-)